MGGYGSGKPIAYAPACISPPMQMRSQDDPDGEIPKQSKQVLGGHVKSYPWAPTGSGSLDQTSSDLP